MNMSALLIERDETNQWTAQCLEYDIAAQGETKESAFAALLVLVGRYMNERAGGLEGIPSAPKEYQDMFDNSEGHIEMPSIPQIRFSEAIT